MSDLRKEPSSGPAARRTWRTSIQFQLVAGFALFSVCLIGMTVLLFQIQGKHLLTRQNYRLLEETGNRIVADLGNRAIRGETLCHALANMSEEQTPTPDTYRTMLPLLMQDEGKTSIVAGGGVWPEPFSLDPRLERASFFWGREPSGNLRFFEEYNDPKGNGYHHEEWYVPARYIPRDQCFWSKSYMDPYSYQPMVTCSVPIWRENRLFGVETIDLKLEGLHAFLEKAGTLVEGYGIALDRNNKFLSYPLETKAKIYSSDERGNQVQEFMGTSQFASRHPLFGTIAGRLEQINRDIIKDTPYNTGLASRMSRESYQISEAEGRLIASMFLDPMSRKTESTQMIDMFTVDNDEILHCPVVVTVFHVPRTYWKVVLVSPTAFVTSGADQITRTMLASLLGMMAALLVLTFGVVRVMIIRPLKKMTLQLREMSLQEGAQGPALDESLRNELGEVAYWFNHRTGQLARTMQSLRHSESEYRVLFENFQDMFYRTDEQGRIVMVSPSCEMILGYTPQEAMGKELANDLYLYPEERDEFLSRMMVAGKVEDFQTQVRRKDGTVIWVSVNAHLWLDDAGIVRGVEGIARDITNRRMAEQEIANMRSYLKNIFDSMPSILISINVNGLVMEWNQAATEMTGIPAALVLGRPLWEVAPSFERYRREYLDVIQSRTPRKFAKQSTLGKEDKVHDVTLFPLIANGVNGLVIRLDDVTEMEKMENQLRQAQKMDTIGTLAGGLAHDFNNVLGGITGTLSILRYDLQQKKEISLPELTSHVTIMEEAALRASDIVQQLLTLSRKQELSLDPVDLNLTVKHVMKICQNAFDKSIVFDVQFSPTPAVVHADTGQIEQMLLNLCVNASHAMTMQRPEGVPHGGRLTISMERIHGDRHFCQTHPEAREIEYWILSVIDTGVGMDSKTVAKIFDPFYTTKPKEKGTGLGLAMVYSIIQQHGGFIDVYTELGTGSKFNVFLPVIQREAIAKDEPTLEISRGEGLVLVVDDEKIMRTVAKTILEECGYRVLLAEDGEEGLRLFQQFRQDVSIVLMDMVMPKMDGVSTCREILKIAPDTRIVLASGFKQDERIETALNLGAMAFLQKPYTMDRLSRIISQTLAAPSGKQEGSYSS